MTLIKLNLKLLDVKKFVTDNLVKERPFFDEVEHEKFLIHQDELKGRCEMIASF